jgi:alpha-N-acetylglucosaminidase
MASAVGFEQEPISSEAQIRSVRGIIERLTPDIAGKFLLEIIPKKDNLDVFEIETKSSKIVLRGSTGVALASAFNRYLKEYCKCHVSWCGDQLKVPDPLPEVPEKIRVVCLHRHRVYFNYCTLSYSASWWDWKRWEREIDIMALNGINMPLAPIGLEGVWYHALLRIGLTDVEAREYLVGPCYLAWQWMTNIQSHGGPLPREWIDSHIVLGRRILERQRSLGMTPIQQGFSGFVPRLFQDSFPTAAISKEQSWCGFEGTCQLDPLDPLFKEFGKIFIETEIELFGTSHIYAADPFHEGHPPIPGDEYLKKVGQAIWGLMREVDPEAHWAMQAWSIREPVATQVPKGRLLVLDLSGKRDGFWGHDFIKGQLHNFGGRINMHGDLRAVAENPFAVAVRSHETCTGMGLFMEGIEQNPVFYEMVFDTVWHDAPVAPGDWLDAYAERRYGCRSKNAEKAWALLLDGPYKRGTDGVESSSIIAARPAIRPLKSGPNAGFSIPYASGELVLAWDLLLVDHCQLETSDAYQFDIMDVGRQVFSNLGQELVRMAEDAFRARDRAGLSRAAEQFLGLLADVDRLLATRDEYNFHLWVNRARAWGATSELADYYEWNASMLVTIWGPSEAPLIFDYSWREWAGLISLYYLPRWKMFYDHLDAVLAEGGTYSDPDEMTHGRHSLRANAFYCKLADWELAWPRETHEIAPHSIGDTVRTALELAEKYRSRLGIGGSRASPAGATSA